MTIASIVAASGTPSLTSPTTTASPKQKMDSEMFLQLLVTQLRTQDPSSPMNTNEMMAQTTQLASMEQLTTMTGLSEENFSLQMRIAAAGMIGKQVTYTAEDGTSVTGIASAVSFADKVPTVTVDGKAIKLDAISGVTTNS
jgi:flagellar basal-body rod modification protein FlgD